MDRNGLRKGPYKNESYAAFGILESVITRKQELA